MTRLQDKLYADGREGLVVMFQAMDAAGKDSTIKRVMSGVNPQGVSVYSFKQPSSEELAHDYLWRAIAHLPKRGHIELCVLEQTNKSNTVVFYNFLYLIGFQIGRQIGRASCRERV